MSSPNMSLPIPTTGQTPGPDYANNVNDSLNIIDAHDHSSGSGVPIDTTGINITADFSLNQNDLINTRSTRYENQSSPFASAPPDAGCVYVSGGNLYYNNLSGAQVQITNGPNVNAGAGSITGLVSPASATYSSLSQSFIFQSNANTAASVDMRDAILRNSTVSSFKMTVSPPAAMGADTNLTLPPHPLSTSFVTLNSSGTLLGSISTNAGITGSNIAATTITGGVGGNIGVNTVTGENAPLSNLTLGSVTGSYNSPGVGSNLAAGTIAGSNIGAATISGSNIAATTITGSNLVNGTVTGTQIQTNPVLNGTNLTIGAYSTLSSPAENMIVIRGGIQPGGAIDRGSGFSVGHTVGTGVYLITFSVPFNGFPVVVATGANSYVIVTVLSSSQAQLTTTYLSGPDDNIDFIAIGQR